VIEYLKIYVIFKFTDIPSNVDIIGEECLTGCKELREVKMFGKSCVIKDGAFAGCFKLEDIWLKENLKNYNLKCAVTLI
jgi:hypothetical protein